MFVGKVVILQIVLLVLSRRTSCYEWNSSGLLQYRQYSTNTTSHGYIFLSQIMSNQTISLILTVMASKQVLSRFRTPFWRVRGEMARNKSIFICMEIRCQISLITRLQFQNSYELKTLCYERGSECQNSRHAACESV